MKTSTSSCPRLLPFFALASALAIASPALTYAAETPEGKPPMPDKMMAGCEEMMERKKEMMTAMQAQDTALAAQVAAMNSAPAGKKSELMAAIVTSLVAQRADQNMKAGKMQEKMMSHMMDHMRMGKESMAKCSMMSMGDMDEKSASPHQGYGENKK